VLVQVVKFKGDSMNYEIGIFIVEEESIFGMASLLTKKGRVLGFCFHKWILGVEISYPCYNVAV
jgi:hypothetical protein